MATTSAEAPALAPAAPRPARGQQQSQQQQSQQPQQQQQPPPQFFACYLLVSLSPDARVRSYIGFTVNPPRRLRQHNGEIASGAFRTRR